MNETNFVTLKASDRHWYGDGNNQEGKEHILDNVSFEDDFHPFYVKTICNTKFQTRFKDSATSLDTSKGVNCFKCMIKAGFLKYHSPLLLEYGAMKKPQQIGKNYTVLIPFKNYEVGDIYEYLYKTV